MSRYTHPATLERVENTILVLRAKHPCWGARKLKARLEMLQPDLVWPAASTFGNILRRAGLTSPQKKRKRTTPCSEPFSLVTGPNQLWCMDFKGYFATGDGKRCDPFTITDAHSRYLIRCQIVSRMDLSQVRAICEAAMREYGMPARIRTDNGAPFAGTGLQGLSKLSLGWMKLGIVHERIPAGRPQQNGRHERMHRTLKEDTTNPPASSLQAQRSRPRNGLSFMSLIQPYPTIEILFRVLVLRNHLGHRVSIWDAATKIVRRSAIVIDPDNKRATCHALQSVDELGNAIPCPHLCRDAWNRRPVVRVNPNGINRLFFTFGACNFPLLSARGRGVLAYQNHDAIRTTDAGSHLFFPLGGIGFLY